MFTTTPGAMVAGVGVAGVHAGGHLVQVGVGVGINQPNVSTSTEGNLYIDLLMLIKKNWFGKVWEQVT